jgi:hypothetical protein
MPLMSHEAYNIPRTSIIKHICRFCFSICCIRETFYTDDVIWMSIGEERTNEFLAFGVDRTTAHFFRTLNISQRHWNSPLHSKIWTSRTTHRLICHTPPKSAHSHLFRKRQGFFLTISLRLDGVFKPIQFPVCIQSETALRRRRNEIPREWQLQKSERSWWSVDKG